MMAATFRAGRGWEDSVPQVTAVREKMPCCAAQLCTVQRIVHKQWGTGLHQQAVGCLVVTSALQRCHTTEVWDGRGLGQIAAPVLHTVH